MSATAKPKGAFTLAELLVALAITAVLLASVAVAMHGSMMTYTENERLADVTKTARIVLLRLSAHVRTAEAVESGDRRLSIIPPANPQAPTRLEYELVDGVLYYRRTIGGKETSHVLVGNGEVQVEGFEVTCETVQDGEDPAYTRTVQVELTLRSGVNRRTFTASACPRRNLTY